MVPGALYQMKTQINTTKMYEQKLKKLKEKGYKIHRKWVDDNVIHVVILQFRNERKYMKLKSLCSGLNIHLHFEKRFTSHPITTKLEWLHLSEAKELYRISNQKINSLVAAGNIQVMNKGWGSPNWYPGMYLRKSDMVNLKIPLRSMFERFKVAHLRAYIIYKNSGRLDLVKQTIEARATYKDIHQIIPF
jgi:hypothetical protein